MEKAHPLPLAGAVPADGNPTDEQLLAFVGQQDVTAYEALYYRYVSSVYNLILRLVRQHALAEDLAQETFWQVLRDATSYRGDGPVAAWIGRIARHRALDELRRQHVRAPKARTACRKRVWPPPRDGIGTAAAEIQSYLDQQVVRQAIATLPAEQRLCLELCYWEGWTQQEIAAHCQVAPGTVKSRLRLARQKLAYVLRSQGYP